MAIHIFGQLDIDTMENQIPISDESIIFEKPYYYNIKIDDKQILYFEVKQLRWKEYNELYSKIAIFKTILESDFKDNITTLLPNIHYFISEFSHCVNADIVLEKFISDIQNAKSKDEITIQHYYKLFENLLLIDIIPSEYTKYTTKNKMMRKIAFKFHELKNFRSLTLDRIQYFANVIEKYIISTYLSSLTVDQILDIIDAIVRYNTVIPKKKLQKIMETMTEKAMKANTNFFYTLK